MKFLRDIPYLKDVKALVRVDFNVPIKDGVVADDFRIKSTLPTIQFLLDHGAKVILAAHIESNDGDDGSLKPVADYLDKLGVPVVFIKDLKNAHEIIDNKLEHAGCVLLENLRFFEGEKKNDKKFAEQLASLGDIFVNEAFSVSHREHASIVGLPRFLPSYAGLQFEREVLNLSRAFDPAHPFLFILGGAKFETKLPLLERFISVADRIFVGGALAHDLLKAKGYEIGESLVSKGPDLDFKPFIDSPKLLLPPDVVVATKEVKPANGLSKADQIMDAGPKTLELLRREISEARFILWNGPLGHYEGGFQGPTLELAKMIGEAAGNGAVSIVGGGDTLAAIAELRIFDKFTFVSTGGGAMLDFLATGTLPGIQALEKSQWNQG